MQTLRRTADIRIGEAQAGGTATGACSALKCIRGVEEVGVEPQMRHITVTYDALRVSQRQLEKAVRVMGCEIERLDIRLPDPEAADPAGDAAAASTTARDLRRE